MNGKPSTDRGNKNWHILSHRPRYLIINADEGEPGTCKDREILRKEPHKLIEGCLLVGSAMKAQLHMFTSEASSWMKTIIFQNAVKEAYSST